MKCIENRFFTPDGPVEDEAELKQLILKELQAFIIHGLSKRVANLLESLRIIAYSAPLDIEVDCIHLKNGIYHLADGTFQESRLFCRNRLPVAYNQKAAKPERWLAFLNELLEPEDIPTLQEYLGYCLIPCTKGQKMMFLLGKGGEGKSRIESHKGRTAGMAGKAEAGRAERPREVQQLRAAVPAPGRLANSTGAADKVVSPVESGASGV